MKIETLELHAIALVVEPARRSARYLLVYLFSQPELETTSLESFLDENVIDLTSEFEGNRQGSDRVEDLQTWPFSRDITSRGREMRGLCTPGVSLAHLWVDHRQRMNELRASYSTGRGM